MEPLEDNATLILSFKWTNEHTTSLIKLRHENREYFTGKRNTARTGWEVVLKEMGIDHIVSVKQAKKKWDNLVHKYKELKGARIGTAEGEIAATSWPFYHLMEEAMGSGPLVTLPVVIASISENDGVECGESSNASLLCEANMLGGHMIHEGTSYQANPNPQRQIKKRRREPDDAYMELFQQTRQDWLKMHNTFERQGERMVSLLGDLIKSIKKK